MVEQSAPAISVIIPHLNQEESLAQCLASLEPQLASAPAEVIVVDNGSRSLPEKVCARFGVRLEQEPVPGPGPARNRGIACARADVLAFIDADCTAALGWIAAIFAHLVADAREVVLGGDVRVGRAVEGRTALLEAYESVYAYRQREYIESKGFSGTGNLAMPRRLFDRVGPFAGIGVAEDRDWGRRAGRLGIDIRFVPEMVVYHPARKSFGDLKAKWDRHVAHDFEGYARPPHRRILWLGYAIAVAVSPLAETWRIATSDRVTGLAERVAAFVGLVRIRLYRCRRMLSLVLSRDGAAISGAWNRN